MREFESGPVINSAFVGDCTVDAGGDGAGDGAGDDDGDAADIRLRYDASNEEKAGSGEGEEI